jgi:hypothetical protein
MSPRSAGTRSEPVIVTEPFGVSDNLADVSITNNKVA